jgi:streptomycin 6-kinase
MDKATSLATLVASLWARLNEPCSAQARAQALRFAERRAAAFNPSRSVLVHGDAAPANALRVLADRRGAETGFVFVDPDGFVGDPAYDLGVALRDWCPQIIAAEDPVALTRSYCRLLASGSGLDEQAIWEWGYLERVSTGLYATAMGAHELGRPFLDTAEMLL